jgi:cell division protease FtsH
VVDVLIEKESLDGDEFRAIVAEFTTIPEKERFSPLLGSEAAKSQPEPAQA